MKRLGITMGDPAGVGPEIIMKALGDGTEFGENTLCTVLSIF